MIELVIDEQENLIQPHSFEVDPEIPEDGPVYDLEPCTDE